MKKSILSLILVFCCFFLNAQEYSIPEIKRSFNNFAGTIYADEEVSGYYFFTLMDKSSGGQWNYNLTVLDLDLNKLSSTAIPLSKQSTLVSASAVDDAILLKIFDRKESIVVYRMVDFAGRVSSTQTREVDKFEKRLLNARKNDDDIGSARTFDRGDSGFLDFVNLDRSAYKVIGLDRAAETIWNYTVPESKGIRNLTVMATNDEFTVLLEKYEASRMSIDSRYRLLVLDSEGKLLFSRKLEDPSRSILPSSVNFDEEKGLILITGQFKEARKNILSAENTGIFFMSLDAEGKIQNQKFIPLGRETRALVGDYDGLLRNSLYFHDIVALADGRIMAVAEEFRVDNHLIRDRTDSQQYNDSEVYIGNIIVFTLSSSFEIRQIELYKKDPYRIEIDGDAYSSPHLLAESLKYRRAFDYRYSQTNDESDYLTFVYTNRENVDSQIFQKLVTNSVTYKIGTPKSDKLKYVVEENRSSRPLFFFPSNGTALVSVMYDRKNKSLKISKQKTTN